MAPVWRLLRWALPALALGVVACSSGGSDRRDLTTPTATPSATATSGSSGAASSEPVTARESAVIRGWSDSLRQGHVARAARYFALPSVVANGTPPLRLRTRAEAAQFNRALSCGATVVSLQRSAHHYVLAAFRLAERPGGDCGGGTGHLAYAAFRIRSGRIVQWLRVPDPAGSAATLPS